jgi:pimeloyl-ACP methyl ester carboxylesterase
VPRRPLRAGLARAVALSVAAAVVTTLVAAPASASKPAPAPDQLPVVFVHGNSGSAAQFASQFQRFTGNGYRQDLLFAYEYDTDTTSNTRAISELGPFIDSVLAVTGSSQVLLAAHSRGTTVSHAWLADPANAAKVDRYVNLDGRSSATPPGGVPTLAIWSEWNSLPNPTRGGAGGAIGGAENVYFRDMAHTEVATSARSFDPIWRFLTGTAPATTDVVPEPPGRVEIAGRAVLFPENVGYAGTSLEVWEVDGATGQRSKARPEAVYAIDETGAWGPLRVHGAKSYEFALTREDGSVHHFYSSPFARSDHFVRLNTARPGTSLEPFTKRSPLHTNFTIVRGREMWGDQGANSDVLTVDLLGDAVEPLNVLTPAVAPRTGPPAARGAGEVNALFLTDVGPRTATGYADSDQQTDLGKGQLFPFPFLTFLSAADVYVPADPQAAGTVRLAMTARGSATPEVVHTPNWPSQEHRVTVSFRDYVQDGYSFTERAGRGR